VQGGQRLAFFALFLPSLGLAGIKQWLKTKNQGPAKKLSFEKIYILRLQIKATQILMILKLSKLTFRSFTLFGTIQDLR